MLIRIFVFLVSVNIFLCKANEQPIAKEKDRLEFCFYAGTWANNFPLFLKNRLKVKISKFEEKAKGLEYNIKFDANSISILAYTSHSPIVLQLKEKIEEIYHYSNENGHAFLILNTTDDATKLELYESYEDAKTKRKLVTGGSLSKRRTYNDCFDLDRMQRLMEEYANEQENGPDPDGFRK